MPKHKRQMMIKVQEPKRGAVVVSEGKPSKGRGRNRSARANSNSAENPLLALAMSMKDPWEHSPPKLGFYSLTDTVQATAFFRESFLVNSTDGSFALTLYPSSASMVLVRNGGAGSGVVGATRGASNSAYIAANIPLARVLSGGIRVFALFPETSASGVLFAGATAGDTFGAVSGTTYTPQFYANHPSAELGLGKKGARSVMIPVDVSAAQFFPQTSSASGYATNTIASYTAPFVAGLGFPVGTVIWYEAVLNLEGLPSNSSNSAGDDVDGAFSFRDTVAASVGSFETAVNYARRLVGNAAVMDGVAAASDLAGFPQAARWLRSSFGTGRNLVSGMNSVRNARQNTVMIEEMKEDAGDTVYVRSRHAYPRL